MQRPIDLPPSLVTPDPIPLTPLRLPELPVNRAPYWNGKVPDVANPKALDSLLLHLPGTIMAVVSIGIQAQQQFAAEFAKFKTTLDAMLDHEIETLLGSPKGTPIDNKQKKLQITRDLITQKRKAIELAQPLSLKFFGRPPLSKNIKQNALEFSLRATKRRAPRLSTLYRSYVDSLSAAYQVRMATEAIPRLEQRAAALASEIAVARNEAKRIAAAKARAEAERAAAAKAKAEAERAAAAKAKAEAERAAAAKAKAEADFVRRANTYAVSGSTAAGGSIFITAAGHVATAAANLSVRNALSSAIGALIGFAGSVGAGLVAGVSALLYSPRLGNGELPARYALQTPLSDLDPQLSAALPSISSASHVELPFRLSSRVTDQDESEIFVVKTDGVNVPSRVPVLTAGFDAQRKVYTATTADIPTRTLTWTPIAPPGDASTALPEKQPETSIYEGATLEPIEVRIDSFPEVADASWDDYVIVFPADSGLPPIYTMFRDRRGEPGVAFGHGVQVDNTWANAVSIGEGAPIPAQIADHLRGQNFLNWRDFRTAFWKAVGNDEFLCQQFSESNISQMKAGRAPFALKRDRAGGRAVLEVHHKTPISKGGEVFDIDNLAVTTPKLHINIHKSRP